MNAIRQVMAVTMIGLRAIPQRLGASLVQLLTALIYQGPGVVRAITLGLAQLLTRDGVKHVRDVVGVDAA